MKKQNDDVIALALELSRHLRRRFMACGKDGSSFMRGYALSIIKESDDMTMKDFAQSMKISASSATAFIDRLTKEGWVKRKHDAKNRKIVHLHLTPAGNRMLARSTQTKREFLHDILVLLSADDRRHVRHTLTALLNALTQESSSHS